MDNPLPPAVAALSQPEREARLEASREAAAAVLSQTLRGSGRVGLGGLSPADFVTVLTRQIYLGEAPGL